MQILEMVTLYECTFWLMVFIAELISPVLTNSCENLMLRNIALGKDTNQSSTRPHDVILDLSFGPDLAVDGNTSSYSQTTNNGAWWWRVDLRSPQLINKIIVIFGPVTASISVSDFQIEHGLYIHKMTQISSSSSASMTSRRREFIFPQVLAKYVQVKSQIQLQLAEVEVYSENVTPDKAEEMLFTPSYVSDWKTIKSYIQSESEVTFIHSLYELPAKVTADILVEDKGVEYYFTNIGAPESDDDFEHLQIIGGVACVYNTHDVTLYASRDAKLNGFDSSQMHNVIYTGTSPYWEGADIRRGFNQAKVRVRVWRDEDFPKPSFKTDWTTVAVESGSPVFFDVSHNLGAVPDIVVAQLKIAYDMYNRELVYECQGSGSRQTTRDYSPICGCTFGFSNTSVRIWIPKFKETKQGALFNLGDGYGTWSGAGVAMYGTIRLRAWKSDTKIYQHTIEDVTNLTTYELPFDIIPEYHFPSIQVIVNEGENKNYHFYGVGSTSNDGTRDFLGNHSGLIYAYSQNKILFWIPGINQLKGHIFSIGGMWGNGTKAQETNNITIRITMWNLFERDTLNCFDLNMDHGRITGDGTIANYTFLRNGSYAFQTNVSLECDAGYSPLGGLASAVCNRSCILDTIVNCKGNPCDTSTLAVNNASFLANDATTGNNVTYTCNYGYKHSSGDMVRICQTNGTWSGIKPTCSRIECNVTELIVPKAAYNYTGYYEGDRVVYRCNNNTILISGDLHRICEISGNWSGNPPRCDDCQCKCVPANEDLEKLVEQLKEELTVKKQETSMYKRKFISIADDRISSVTIGSFGIVFLSLLGVLFIAIDIPIILRQIRMGWHNFRRHSH